MSSMRAFISVFFLASIATLGHVGAVWGERLHARDDLVATLSKYEQDMFYSSMSLLDTSYDPSTGFWDGDTRYSAWYAVGLLGRNQGNNSVTAVGIIQRVIEHQYTDPSKIWYGTYYDPGTPDPSTLSDPVIYDAYDPNVGEFVSTSWIIMLEEFSDLLPASLIPLIEESMYNATVGDGYRVAGWNGDNLRPVYSNPWLMRCIQMAWVGNRMGDENMTFWAENFTQEVVDLFDKYNTLSEFNSPTYEGVSLYALTLWNRYAPAGTLAKESAASIITRIWETIGQVYNPTLKNLGGAWDRTYGFDMNQYFGILGGQIEGLVGAANAPVPFPLTVDSLHYSDSSIMPLLALISPSHDPLVPKHVIRALTTLTDDQGNAITKGHAWHGQAISRPFDYSEYGAERNYSTWTEYGLSLGGMQVKELVYGGPSLNNESFSPAVVLWKMPASGSNESETSQDGVGYMSLFPTEGYILATVNERKLTITYPSPNLTSYDPTIFTLMFGPPASTSNYTTTNLTASAMNGLSTGFAQLPGLNISITGNASFTAVGGGPQINFNASDNQNDFLYWNVTYVVPANLTAPTLEIEIIPTF